MDDDSSVTRCCLCYLSVPGWLAVGWAVRARRSWSRCGFRTETPTPWSGEERHTEKQSGAAAAAVASTPISAPVARSLARWCLSSGPPHIHPSDAVSCPIVVRDGREGTTYVLLARSHGLNGVAGWRVDGMLMMQVGQDAVLGRGRAGSQPGRSSQAHDAGGRPRYDACCGGAVSSGRCCWP